MKRVILLFLMAAAIISAFAQKSQRRPDWMFKVPDDTGAYFYVREQGEPCDTEIDARESAMKRVFRTVSNRTGVRIDQAELERSIQKGGSFEVASRSMDIPINKVCEYTVKQSDGSYIVYMLCQVATIAYYKLPKFDYYDCDQYKQHNDFMRKKNVTAIVASAFVPGVGQMTKHHYGEGVGFLLSEAALIGGGVTMLMLSNKQKSILEDASGSVDYNTYMDAKNKYDTYRYVSYGIFGVAAVVYGVNLWRAWVCKYKFKEMASIYPTVIPDNSMAGLALGIGVNVNF